MKTDSSGVAPLRSDGELHSHPVDQAIILYKQFLSAVSSKEIYSPHEFISRCHMPVQYPPAEELKITENGVLTLNTERTKNLAIIFTTSLLTVEVPSD